MTKTESREDTASDTRSDTRADTQYEDLLRRVLETGTPRSRSSPPPPAARTLHHSTGTSLTGGAGANGR